MPPWENVERAALQCASCGGQFLAKRGSAKYCSTLCQGRARIRPYDAEYRRPYSKKRREKIGDDLRAQERSRMAAVQKFIRAYKLASGCKDCGYRTHHAALEFDHLRDKDINVCNAKSVDQARREIAKCDVVCANCHRVRTFQRLHACKPDIFIATYDAVDDKGGPVAPSLMHERDFE